MLAKIRTLALVLALVAAVVPSFMYITDMHRDWLWLHIGVNIFAYITVAITTIRTTLEVAGREKHKLATPLGLADKPLLATWWASIRLSWRWHVLAAFGRLGLAHALAQHLHVIEQTWNDFQGIISPFNVGTYSNLGHGVEIRSQWITIIIGGMLLLIFGLAETGLLSAFTLLCKRYLNNVFQAKAIIFMRMALIFGLIGVMLAGQKIYKTIEEGICKGQCCYASRGVCGFGNDPASRQISYDWYQLRQDFLLPLQTLHSAGFTLLDNGTMITAEIMLPVGGEIFFYQCYEQEPSGRCIAKTNLPYVLNKLSLSIGGLSLYAILTGFCLFIAQRRQAQPLAAH